MRRGRALRCVGVVVAVVGSGLAAPPGSLPLAAQTSRPEITGIAFSGNQVFPEDSLRAAIVNRQTECKAFLFRPLCVLGVDAAIDRGYLQPRELPLDALRVEAFYWLRGYREAAVDTLLERSDGQVAVTFQVSEGEPIRIDSLTVTGLEGVASPGVEDDLPLSVGSPLSALRIQAVKDTLVQRLQEVGYAYPEVFYASFIPQGTRRARLSFDVDPGPRVRFGPVTVTWDGVEDPDEGPELEETSIRRMVPFSEGDSYRRSQVIEGQRNLYSLDLIRTASVVPARDTLAQDTILPVTIRVTEGDEHWVRTGVGWSTADCLNAESQWSSRNYFGGARRLTLRARVSNILAPELGSTVCNQAGSGEFAELNGQLSAELFQPWLFSPRNSLTASAFVERQSLPDIFVREALGATLAFARIIGRQATATLSYQPALTRLGGGEVFFCVSFLLCTRNDIEVFESANLLSPVGLNLAVNRSNQILNPTSGYSLAVDLEHASALTGSDFSYNRAVGEVAAYRSVSQGVVLAGRLRSGIVSPGQFEKLRSGPSGVPPDLVHPQKRFYSGGAASVRGFAESRLGPQVLTVDVVSLLGVPPGGSAPLCAPAQVTSGGCDAGPLENQAFFSRPTGGNRLIEANLELRFPLALDDFQGALFVDAGEVWGQDVALEPGDIEVTPGLGVRYFSPIGPIRVDVAYRPRRVDALPVLTGGIRPFDPGVGDTDADRIRIRTAGGGTEPIDWVRTPDLLLMTPRVSLALDDSGDPALVRFLRRLQFHFSIGQPF